MDLPVACTLDNREYAERQAALRAGVLAEARGVEPLDHGLRWRFASTPGLLARLAGVIDAERQCCRFLRITVDAAPALGEVTVEITGPAGTRDLLETWLGDRADPAGPGAKRNGR
jgi:hypothetical protein